MFMLSPFLSLGAVEEHNIKENVFAHCKLTKHQKNCLHTNIFTNY